MRLAKLFGLGLAAMCSLLAPVTAATINVDFNGTETTGTFSGTAVAPDAGTIWNGFTPTPASYTSAPLVNSTGGATPVTVSLETFNVYDGDENPATLKPALMQDFIYQTVLGPGGPPGLFAINNLTPGAAYDLYFYSQNSGYSNTATSFTIGATTQIATNVPGGGGPATFIQNTNYVLFPGVVADGSGLILGEFNDVAAANNAAFNGMQITEVPEPASLATVLVGSSVLLLGGMLRRRRSSGARQQAA